MLFFLKWNRFLSKTKLSSIQMVLQFFSIIPNKIGMQVYFFSLFLHDLNVRISSRSFTVMPHSTECHSIISNRKLFLWTSLKLVIKMITFYEFLPFVAQFKVHWHENISELRSILLELVFTNVPWKSVRCKAEFL